jgi:hypothetical protein
MNPSSAFKNIGPNPFTTRVNAFEASLPRIRGVPLPRPTIGEWADAAPEAAASQGLAFEERGQVPPNLADC